MSNEKRRSQSRSAGVVKLAFADDDPPENEETQKKSKNKSKKRTESKKRSEEKKSEEVHMKANFSLGDVTVEVLLDITILSWKTIWVSSKAEKSFLKKLKDDDGPKQVDLKSAYGIVPIIATNASSTAYPIESNRTSNEDKETNSLEKNRSLKGFELHLVDKSPSGELKTVLVTFQSESADQMREWFEVIEKIIRKLRPKRDLLILSNNYAGSKEAPFIYQLHMKPLLERANYNIHHEELSNSTSIEQIFENLGDVFERLYGIVIIGGDGTVKRVINSLLIYTAKINQIELQRENDLPMMPCPICIIPTGTTNLLCNTIHGHTDYLTVLIYLLINQQINIDMSAVFDEEDNFVTASFTVAAGYPAKALGFFNRYAHLPSKKIIQKSFCKASQKKNLQAIKMEIRYIPVEETNKTPVRCNHTCETCFQSVKSQNNDEVQAFDTNHFEKIDQRPLSSLPSRKKISTRSSSRLSSKLTDNNTTPFKSLSGDFLQATVFTNADLWMFAPQGLSKFGHLADGVLHLVMIPTIKRKHFVRYLKRNGGDKDQFNFPFVTFLKVKEVEIEILGDDELKNRNLSINSDQSSESETSWSEDSDDEKPKVNNNQSKSVKSHESNQLPPRPNGSSSKHRHRKHRDDSNNESDEENRNKISETIKMKNNKSNGKDPLSNNGNYRSSRSLNNIAGNSSSFFTTTEKNSTKGQNGNRRRSAAFIDDQNVNNENLTKEPNILPSDFDWNIDFVSYKSKLMRIKCFHRFLPVFGAGVLASASLRSVYYPCL